MEVKKAMTVFHYAEKIKSSLILTAGLLESLEDIKENEVAGAEKMFIAYLNALILEVNIAANASGVRGFEDVSEKLAEIGEQITRHDYASAVKIVSEAISIATTNGNSAAEVLRENNLI